MHLVHAQYVQRGSRKGKSLKGKNLLFKSLDPILACLYKYTGRAFALPHRGVGGGYGVSRICLSFTLK